MVLAHNIEIGLRTQDIKISKDVAFKTMLLHHNTLAGLKKSGFLTPSPIQLHGIPLGKCGFDLILEAKSGTGKTAVFSVIALEKLDLNLGIQSIILAPTREIAFQVCDVIKQIGEYYKGLEVAVVIGGLSIQDDIDKLKGRVHIVVGSPGRLRHLIQDKYLNISSVRLVVLDEADKLLEKSFINDINYIFSLLPKQKQVIMSSATYPEETKTFINKYVTNVQHVCPESNNILLGIEQKVTTVLFHSNIIVQTKNRYEELKKILSKKQFKQCLIFCNYQARVGELHRMLTKDGWPSDQLYGQQEQTERLDALKTLQQYKCRVLVSTDLAARGIDASNVDIVVNFEPPSEWQTYLHRIGRAGRYGAYGMAVSILSTGNEVQKFKDMLVQVNLPINLYYMWSEELFYESDQLHQTALEKILPDQTSDKEPPNDSKTNDNALWQVLTNCEEIPSNGALSFQDLCKDLDFETSNETNCKVPSFTDLVTDLKSFQMNGNGAENNAEYKYVPFNKLPIPVIVSLPLTLNNSDTNNKEYNNVNNGESTNGMNNDRVIPEVSSPLTVNKSNTIKNKEENVNKLNGQSINAINNDNDIVIKNKDSKEEPGNAELTNGFNSDIKDLEDAGLPTAFGGSKYKAPKQVTKLKKVNRNYKEDVYGPWTPIDNTYEESCTQMKFKNESHNHIGKTDIETQNCDMIRKPQTQRRYSVRENNVDRKIRLQRNNSFDAWYSQLKTQTNYIQYCVYLDELSKM